MQLGSKERCMAESIDRHPVGRKLTPEARERAISFAAKMWRGMTSSRAAVEAGISHVTADGPFKEA